MVIRTATINDAINIAKLCFELGYPVTNEQIIDRLKRLLSEKDNEIFVFEMNDGIIAGWVHVFGKHLLELEYAEIGGMVVDSHYRRQGIGEKLMRNCEEWAKAKGYKEVRLRSGGERKEAHQFYTQIGYENTKWQKVSISIESECRGVRENLKVIFEKI